MTCLTLYWKRSEPMKKILLCVVALWAVWSVSANSAAKEETDKLPLLAVAVSDGQALVKILLAKAASSFKAFDRSFNFAATFLDGRKVAVKGSIASVSETLPSRARNVLLGNSSKEYAVSVLLGSVRQQPVNIRCVMSVADSARCPDLKVGRRVVLVGTFARDGGLFGGFVLQDALFVDDETYKKAEDFLNQAGDSLPFDRLMPPEPFATLDGSSRRELTEKAECALAAYPDKSLPWGFRPFSREEWALVASEFGYAEETYSDDGYFVLGNGLRGRLMVHRLARLSVVSWSGCDLLGADALTAGTADLMVCLKHLFEGDVNAQFKQAYEISKAVVGTRKGKIWIVGHSLGGSIATYIALALEECGDRVEVASFNGLGISARIGRQMDAASRARAARRIVNVFSESDPIYNLDATGLLSLFSLEPMHFGRSYFLENQNVPCQTDNPLKQEVLAIRQRHGLEELHHQMEAQSPGGNWWWIVSALVLVCVCSLVGALWYVVARSHSS